MAAREPPHEATAHCSFGTTGSSWPLLAPMMRSACLAAGWLVLVPGAAHAMGNDSAFLRAAAGLVYDSNVLGVSSEIPESAIAGLPGSRERGSWIMEYGAGVRVDLPLSRQRLKLDASVTRSDYAEFPELDYTGYAASGDWQWGIGRDWFGQITADVVQSRQANASGRAFSLPLLVKRYDGLADVHYRLTPRWELGGALGGSFVRYDAEEFAAGDTDLTMQSVEAMYRSPAGNATGVRLTFEQGNWPNAPTTGGDGYGQYTLAAVLDWGVTGRTQLSGDIGYTSSTRSGAAGGSTGGVSGRLSLRYSIGAKTQAEAALYQLFGPLQDPDATYVRTRGMDLGASYLATARTSIAIHATWKTIEYLGAATAPLSEQREDEYRVLGFDAAYRATRTLSLRAGGQYEQRDSNLPLTAYDVYTIYLRGQVEF
jgi:hypothetical protein